MRPAAVQRTPRPKRFPRVGGRAIGTRPELRCRADPCYCHPLRRFPRWSSAAPAVAQPVGPGDKEDPIRERKEETAEEKARDESGGYWDVEPIERKKEDLEETDEEFAHRLPVESPELHAGVGAEVAASALGEIDVRVGLAVGDRLEGHGLGGFAVVGGPAVLDVVEDVLALDGFEVEDEVV